MNYKAQAKNGQVHSSCASDDDKLSAIQTFGNLLSLESLALLQNNAFAWADTFRNVKHPHSTTSTAIFVM